MSDTDRNELIGNISRKYSMDELLWDNLKQARKEVCEIEKLSANRNIKKDIK